MITDIAILVAALLLGLVVHEAAHALALRNLGFPISRAGLGMPLPPTLTIPPRGRRTFALTLSPWLFGAYVQPDERYEKQIEALPYRDRAWFLNAGIVLNVILGLALWVPAFLLVGRMTAALLAGAGAMAVWGARRWVAAYVAPAAAPILLGVVAVGLSRAWAAGETGAGYAGMTQVVPDGGLAHQIHFFGSISLALGLLNALPLFGLDNGKVVGLLVERWCNPVVTRIYQSVGLAIILTLLLLAFASDLWAIGKGVVNALS